MNLNETFIFRKIRNTNECKVQIMDVIGRGAYGIVFKCVREKRPKDCFAAKILMNKKTKKTENFLFENELLILETLNHEHIVKLFGYNRTNDVKILVFELCLGGSLYSHITQISKENQEIGFHEDNVLIIAYQLSDALAYIHNRGIIHRDIKSQNAILKKRVSFDLRESWQKIDHMNTNPCMNIEEISKNSSIQTKLIDFGLSIKLGSSKDPPNKICGTASFMAPEVANGRYYSRQCDVFSFGMLLVHLLAANCPLPSQIRTQEQLKTFYEDHDANILLEPLKKLKITSKCIDFIESALQFDPINRFSANQMKLHFWLNENGVTSQSMLSNSILSNTRLLSGIKRPLSEYNIS